MFLKLSFQSLDVGLFLGNYSLEASLLGFTVVPGAEGVEILHSGLGASELLFLGEGWWVDMDDDALVNVLGLQVSELLEVGAVGRHLEGDSDELLLARLQGERLRHELILGGIEHAEETVFESVLGAVGHLDQLLVLLPELQLLRLHRDHLLVHAVRTTYEL